MKRKLLVGAFALTGGALMVAAGTLGWKLHSLFGPEPATTTAPPKTPSEARILATLKEMQKTGNLRLAVPESDGRRLRLLTEAVDARNVVEVGTSTGYSALWLCLGVRHAEGHVTTFEIDERHAEIAREHFRRAGVDKHVSVVVGDAHRTLAMVKSPIDVVFLDADKEGYVDYLDKLLPLVRPGGLILAHNVEYAPEYMKRVTADPELDTVRLTHASGLSVTMKKR